MVIAGWLVWCAVLLFVITGLRGVRKVSIEPNLHPAWAVEKQPRTMLIYLGCIFLLAATIIFELSKLHLLWATPLLFFLVVLAFRIGWVTILLPIGRGFQRLVLIGTVEQHLNFEKKFENARNDINVMMSRRPAEWNDLIDDFSPEEVFVGSMTLNMVAQEGTTLGPQVNNHCFDVIIKSFDKILTEIKKEGDLDKEISDSRTQLKIAYQNIRDRGHEASISAFEAFLGQVRYNKCRFPSIT